jgi:protein-disulfide isomerase
MLFGLVFSWILFFLAGHSVNRWLNPEERMDAVWATFGDNQQVKKIDVWPLIENDIRQVEINKYELKKRAIKEFINKALSSSQKKPDQSFAVSFSEDEFNKFLNERNIKKNTLSKSELLNARNNFEIQLRQKGEQVFNSELYQKAQVRYLIPRTFDKVVHLKNGPFPARGQVDGKISVIYIANFHCPFCSLANQRISELMSKYQDRISVFFRFQVQESVDSINFRSAEAAYCAQDQNLFWKFYEILIANPPAHQAELMDLAKSAQLDLNQLTKCLDSGTYRQTLIEESKNLLEKGLSDSPTFVIQGREFKGVPSLEYASGLIKYTNP